MMAKRKIRRRGQRLMQYLRKRARMSHPLTRAMEITRKIKRRWILHQILQSKTLEIMMLIMGHSLKRGSKT
jgi:hypothetical protein